MHNKVIGITLDTVGAATWDCWAML